MRIRSVTLEGFGPFKTKQVVDFRAFDADGLFLIAGETGAGKSSILDAIAYALYNKTPRWDKVSGTGASNAVRSDFCGVNDLTEVVVEFETNGEEYRVTRSPEYDRPKARGDGVTKQGSKILVEVLEAESWVGKATKEREAGELIEGLVKLNKDEFLQVIMLAQGRFHEFLLANSDQRLDLLSKLFGTGRFAEYQLKIAERRSALSRKVESARAKRTMLLAGIETPDELGEPQFGREAEWLDAVMQTAVAELDNAKRVLDAAETAEKLALERLDVARRQIRRASAEKALAVLDTKQQSIDIAKVGLLKAERAERVRPLLEDATAKSEELKHAENHVAQMRLGYGGKTADDALTAEVSRLVAEIGSLADALEDEQRGKKLGSDLAAQILESEKLTADLADLSKSIEELQSERQRLVPIASQSEAAENKVKQANDRLAAATEAANVNEKLRKAQEAQLTADKRLTVARATADRLLDVFLHGQAAVLAATLVTGEACSVCGSLEHPSPASFSGEVVSQEDVDDAQADVARHEPAAKSSRDLVDGLKMRAAELSGVSGAENVDTLAAAVAQARAEFTGATDAEKRVLQIDSELSGDDGLLATQKDVSAASKRSGDQLTALKIELDTLTKKITRLRGVFVTVKARHESIVAERDAAHYLAEAIATFVGATKQLAAAHGKLDAKLEQERFESAEGVIESLLNEDEMDDLRQQIDAHAASISENQGILKQPDLGNLPKDLIEVEHASSNHLNAQAASRIATSKNANAVTTLNQLKSKMDELGTLLVETEELITEYEVLHRLAETVNGRTPNTRSMSLESYYLAAELEEVLASANTRLRTLSRGRFEFHHTERGVRRANVAAGLEIEVFDEHTGTVRPAHQLSGGQQFLASLALALGLAEVVTNRAGGIELNTLFVDEGFGGLSDDYLEIAMETLDSLKQGGRTVGVISHVASMQEQIGAQLRVVAEPGGPSEIVQASV
ncbi:MAG: SMC family ATPase [Salinibacterium sp.]|nr:MAG: SMC family ATPase [Salinibacterium sp.]